jgi:DNA-binding transcriptional MerR regulator
MNIRDVEIKTGLTKRMIRHYEEFGLLSPQREENGYRDFSEEDLNRLLCIKAMREVGFSLNEVASVLKDETSEETFRRHLKDLLERQQEKFLEYQGQIKIIKKVLNSNSTQSNLLDKIALAHAPAKAFQEVDDIEDFFQKRHVVHGHILPLEQLKKKASFGFKGEYRIKNVNYRKYGTVLQENWSRASISLCKELYAYVILFSSHDVECDPEFHKLILSQFSQQWGEISYPLTLKFDALTDDPDSLTRIFSSFDLATTVLAEDLHGRQIELVMPGQPLIAYLSQKAGVDYNNGKWMEN